MGRMVRRIVLCAVLACGVWTGMLLADRQKLNEELIRLHVVANSDSEIDQNLKLRVRDAILDSLQEGISQLTDVQQAKAYLYDKLPQLQQVAQQTLEQAGTYFPVTVSLEKEAFPRRQYDTFSLPAGVYHALRITIGTGEGHNWWCVVFPTLCVPATAEGFEQTAACADFSDDLTATLEGQPGYEVRFYLLDALGRLENFLFGA